jgi:hypothetical protein
MDEQPAGSPTRAHGQPGKRGETKVKKSIKYAVLILVALTCAYYADESRRAIADNQHGEDIQQAKKTIEEAQPEITPAPTPDKEALDEARGVRAISQTETPEEQRGREYYAAKIQLNAEWKHGETPILENLDATTMGGVDSPEKARIAMQAVNAYCIFESTEYQKQAELSDKYRDIMKETDTEFLRLQKLQPELIRRECAAQRAVYRYAADPNHELHRDADSGRLTIVGAEQYKRLSKAADEACDAFNANRAKLAATQAAWLKANRISRKDMALE